MGKPFKREVEQLFNTINWAVKQETDNLSNFFQDYSELPLFVVGSGGSLSACYLASNLYQKTGIISKAITPLDLFYSKEALKKSKILFISSSGKNADIMFGFKIAIQQEPAKLLTLCMRPGSALSKLTEKYSNCNAIDYDIPSKKDGFLATNTLLAYFIILCRAFGYTINNFINSVLLKNQLEEIENFAKLISLTHTITILYGGWGQSIATDIESKFTESALGNVNIADYRNFGHGRHNWFAIRQEKSAIIALITPEEKLIAEKTLRLIPNSIATLMLESKIFSPISSIELLVKSFQLVNALSNKYSIDPGKPIIPDYGRKLYNLRYSSFYRINSPLITSESLHILRKTKVRSLQELNEVELNFWIAKYQTFIKKLRNTSFGIVILDYDGTLCPIENRYFGIPIPIRNELIRLLKERITIGIATGRGKSVKKELLSFIPENLQNNVIVGYYNGTIIGDLMDEKIPNIKIKTNNQLKNFYNELISLKSIFPYFQEELRSNQLTVTFSSVKHHKILLSQIQILKSSEKYHQLEILESSHSIDIIVKKYASKLNIIEFCIERARKNNKSEQFLCIGDRGQWPGNDYELLSTVFSLSVDDVSFNPDTCWNIASLGIKNSDATYEYLKRLQIKNGNLVFI